MHLIILCAFTFLSLIFKQSFAQSSDSITTVLKNITDPSVYNKWLLPPRIPGKPLEVQVRAFVYHIKPKEAKNLKINMHVLLELLWEDTRLSYNEDNTGLNVIIGGRKLLKRIWQPHVFFSNRLESQAMGSISKDDFLTLFPNGSVYFTTRLNPTLACRLDLTKFPFDEQNCELFVHHSSYNTSELLLDWDRDVPLQFRNLTNSFTEFNVLSVESDYSSNGSGSPGEDEQANSLVIRVRLARCYGYYFLNYYLPSALIVAISWVTFWLEPSATPGRVTIGASTMLTFIQLCWSAQGRQKSSQFMVYDVWAVTCTAFIFLSLTEFAFVNTIDRKGRGKKLYMKKISSKYILKGGVNTAVGRARLRRSSSCPSSPEIRRHFAQKQQRKRTISEMKEVSLSLQNLSNGSSHNLGTMAGFRSFTMFSMTPQEIAAWIDDKSKIVFPVAFFVFNIFYWLPIFIVK